MGELLIGQGILHGAISQILSIWDELICKRSCMQRKQGSCTLKNNGGGAGSCS